MEIETDLTVSFFKVKSSKWNQFKKAWDACKEANVGPPAEVVAYFNHKDPDENIPGEPVLEDLPILDTFKSKTEHGYIIDLKLLPREVRFVKVCSS